MKSVKECMDEYWIRHIETGLYLVHGDDDDWLWGESPKVHFNKDRAESVVDYLDNSKQFILEKLDGFEE